MITTRKKAVYGISLLLLLTLFSFVSAQSNRPEICTPNSVWCGDGDNIMKCDDDGGEYFVIQECKTGEVCKTENSQPKCVSAKEETNVYLYLFVGLILLFLVILIIILTRQKRKK